MENIIQNRVSHSGVEKVAFASLTITLILFGLIAGFFYAYSVDVMPALDILPPVEAIHAMQAINIVVRNPVFFITFFGPLLAGAITSLLFVFTKNRKAALLTFVATLVYFFTAFLPTTFINVPMNNELALLQLTSRDLDIANIWVSYSQKWTFWNTARCIGSTIAFVFVGFVFTLKRT